MTTVGLIGTLDTKRQEYLWLRDQLNGTPFPIREGDAVYIPANTLHSTYNTTWRPLRLVVVYTPGGAETGLDGLPDARILEPGSAPRWSQAS